MSNLFIPYQPGFIDNSANRDPIPFETFEELQSNEWLLRHKSFPDFERFEYSPDSFLLMSTHNKGYEWYVVGRVLPGLPELPVWEPKYRTE